MKCHWNNTIENPFVQRALNDAGLARRSTSRSARADSTDEMCLEIFGLALDAPPAPAITMPELPEQIFKQVPAR